MQMPALQARLALRIPPPSVQQTQERKCAILYHSHECRWLLLSESGSTSGEVLLSSEPFSCKRDVPQGKEGTLVIC